MEQTITQLREELINYFCHLLPKNVSITYDEKEIDKIIQEHFVSIPVGKPVKPANDGNIFEMNIYTGRVNGSDIHQKEEQYVWFIANNKKQIEQLINDLCRVIRQTDETNTHNETIAGIIGDANRLSV